jgi:tRNA(Ile)-lysidine synthase
MARLGPLAAGQSRSALVAEVAAALAHLAPGAAAIVACSGGPDSTVLAHLVAEARGDLRLSIAHVRHGLRDDRRDLEVVTRHADWLGLDLDVVEVTVASDGHGIEAAARDARYAALRRITAERGAEVILVGHTADDQAETVLLRMARGTGIDGLAAMAPIAGDLVRPLLGVRRVDVRRFAVLEGLPTAEDPTNVDPRVRRAVVRHELLEVLQRVAADPVGALTRLADLARDDRQALEALAADASRIVRRVGDVRLIADADLAALPRGLARRVVRDTLAGLAGRPPDAASVERAVDPDAAAMTLPGPVEVTAAGGWRTFAPRRLPHAAPVALALPGVAVWSPAQIAIQAITAASDPFRPRASNQVALAIDVWSPPPVDTDPARVLPGGVVERMHLSLPDDVPPLTVRHRAPGDRVRTGAGTRTLQDVLVDARVPRPVRDLWPVVATGDHEVVWVPGLVADQRLLRAGRAAPVAQLRVTAA